jgi:hypothetical protein
MSYPNPEGQPPLAPFTPAPKRRPAGVAVIVAVVAVVVAAAAVTFAVLGSDADESTATDGSPAAFGVVRATTTTTTTSTFTRTPYVPVPEDFVLEVQVLEQYEFSATEEFVSTPPGATLTAAVTQVF